jgi:hypothetical protein
MVRVAGRRNRAEQDGTGWNRILSLPDIELTTSAPISLARFHDWFRFRSVPFRFIPLSRGCRMRARSETAVFQSKQRHRHRIVARVGMPWHTNPLDIETTRGLQTGHIY